ncbi:SPRY domain-containing protein 7 [Nephila pilipes]|uniref:SPRY domain-containing protein 7 n=1 Tax=Nephila pilipes TaxID=299642 RepID=A0A8X6T9Y8_NEPPI|nr:SPRY domain-containing protein 7 [Nephila pilipes]
MLPQFKMASCMNCFRRCCDGNVGGSYVQMKEQPAVLLDTSHMGQEVVIVKNGHRVCGTGAALATVPIVQNKAYFEMKLQQSGVWGVGLATRHADLNRVPLGRDKESWVLTSDGTIVHNGDVLYKLSEMPMEGDIVGVSYDHVEINFYVNGKNLMCPVTGAKGEVFPVLYVDDGAILDAAFTTFTHQPPPGFDRIMVEKSLL